MNYLRSSLLLSLILLLGVFHSNAQSLTSGQGQDGTVTVAVLSLNDFHGAFVQNPDQGIPGAASVLQTVDSLKAVYPHHLVVSAGDNFGGSYFYTATQGALLPTFFDELGIRISAVGNHEFDDGQDVLARKWADVSLRPKGWDLTYVCANVLDADGRIPAYMQPYVTPSISLGQGDSVRLLITGLLASSAKEQISARRIEGMTFRGDYAQVLDSLALTPDFQRAAERADLRLLLMHIGTTMRDGRPAWNDKNPDDLAAIKPDFYQAYLTGHSHEPVCGLINESQKPVVQGYWHGNYIGLMKFKIDARTHRVVSIEPEIVPVPLRSRETLTPHALRLQEMVDSLLEVTKTQAGVSIGTVLTQAPHDMPHDRTDKYRISEVGTLVCKGYAEAYDRAAAKRGDKDEIVVGVGHFGGIRAGIVKGTVRVLDVGEILPFQNAMCAFRVDGKLLKELLEFGYHNERYGWLQYGRLRVERDKKGHVRRVFYQYPDGRETKIGKKTPVVIVADEFLSGGGDGYDTRFFPQDKRISIQLPAATDTFIQYLQARKQVTD